MAYQSSYTGAQVDELLDKINNLSTMSDDTEGLAKLGNGLVIDENSVLSVNCGEGLTINNSNVIIVNLDESKGLQTDTDGKLSVNVKNDEGLLFDDDGGLYINKIPANALDNTIIQGSKIDLSTFPIMTTDEVGIARLGAGLLIENNDALSVNLGEGLLINENNNALSVNLGEGLLINENNALSVNLGEGLSINENDALSVNLDSGLLINENKISLELASPLCIASGGLSLLYDYETMTLITLGKISVKRPNIKFYFSNNYVNNDGKLTNNNTHIIINDILRDTMEGTGKGVYSMVYESTSSTGTFYQLSSFHAHAIGFDGNEYIGSVVMSGYTGTRTDYIKFSRASTTDQFSVEISVI